MNLIPKCVLLVACTNATANDEIADQPPRSESSTLPALHFTGDARYRYEDIDSLGPQYDRQRVRARFGVEADVTPTSRAVFKLSTGSGDPRSAHITFSGGYSRKEVGVDLAYLAWKPSDAVVVSVGKIVHPTWRPRQSLFIGGDFNPEGVALRYAADSGIFTSGYSFWLEDGSSSEDARHHGAQLGYALESKATAWTVAISFNELTHVKGALPFLDGANAFGNSVDSSGTFASEFEILDASTQWTHHSHVFSTTLFAHAAHNTRAQRSADAYALGAELAPKLLPYDLRGSYQYARIGQDSLFGQHMDGDFGGGVTNSRGHVFRLSSQPSARTRATLSYFDNEVGHAAARYDFKLIQLDVDLLF